MIPGEYVHGDEPVVIDRARTSVVVAYRQPDEPSRTRMLLRVQARDLLDVLRGMRAGGAFRVEHIYDY